MCDGTEANNSTQALSTEMVFFGCKQIDNKNKEAKKRIDKELMKINVYLFRSKGLVSYCFLVFRCTGEYTSLDLFYFVSSPAVIHSFITFSWRRPFVKKKFTTSQPGQ